MEDRKGFWIVSELATGGELMERIIKSPQFSEKDASKYFRQMCEAVKWCHEHNVVHRDLKPENFLMKNPAADSDLTLTDFGLSCFIATPDTIITDACGSAYYIAPEVFTRQYTKVGAASRSTRPGARASTHPTTRNPHPCRPRTCGPWE